MTSEGQAKQLNSPQPSNFNINFNFGRFRNQNEIYQTGKRLFHETSQLVCPDGLMKSLHEPNYTIPNYTILFQIKMEPLYEFARCMAEPWTPINGGGLQLRLGPDDSRTWR